MWSATTAIWSVASLATLGVIARPWNLPEYIWAVAGAVLLVACGLLSWRDAAAAVGKGLDALLRAELDGYADYARRVRFRLVPGFW